jgi:hypothetical protein
MNSKTQFDLHPDAESLNAFVEQALAEQERGLILAHLAECSRCRQVVYLAQEAAAGMETAAAGSTLRPAARQRLWLRRWWLVWAPVGALAATVTLAYVVHLRRVEMAAEMAKVAPQAAMQNEGESAKPAAPALAEMQAVPPPAATPARPEAKGLKPPLGSAASKKAPSSAAKKSAGEAGDVPGASHDEAAISLGASGAGYPAASAGAAYQRGPATAAREAEQEQAAAGSQIYTAAAKAMAQAKAKEPAKQKGTGGVLTAAASPAPFAQNPAPPVGFDAGKVHGMGRAFAVYRANPPELPSGLLAISTASAQHSMLAVDRLGSVFLSEDSGIHWESVATQWSGRVVAVRVEPAADATSGAAQSLAPTFEVVNDQGRVWVSTGGRIWNAK